MDPRTVRSAWLTAAATSGTVLLFVGAKVLDIVPRVTAMDVGAVAVTGVLTGLFLGFGLRSTGQGRAS